MTGIGIEAFKDCTALSELKVHNRQPWALEYRFAYGKISYDQIKRIKLYVPFGTGEAFRHNMFFTQFKEILEYQ